MRGDRCFAASALRPLFACTHALPARVSRHTGVGPSAQGGRRARGRGGQDDHARGEGVRREARCVLLSNFRPIWLSLQSATVRAGLVCPGCLRLPRCASLLPRARHPQRRRMFCRVSLTECPLCLEPTRPRSLNPLCPPTIVLCSLVEFFVQIWSGTCAWPTLTTAAGRATAGAAPAGAPAACARCTPCSAASAAARRPNRCRSAACLRLLCRWSCLPLCPSRCHPPCPHRPRVLDALCFCLRPTKRLFTGLAFHV